MVTTCPSLSVLLISFDGLLCGSGEVLSLMEDLFSGLGSSCIVAGKRSGERPRSVQYSVVFKCLEPDSLYK